MRGTRLDAIDFRDVVGAISPGLQTITYSARQAGANQNAFYTYTMYGVRFKKISRELKLLPQVQDLMSKITMTWVIPQLSIDNCQPIDGAPALTALKITDLITDSNGTVWRIVMIPEFKLLQECWEPLAQVYQPSQ